ncbi:polysaccharide pyruvyl transferase family protein [Citricoccus sp. NPDC055426]|uniref:polysaccharide pyruvyl transferase family protein n=1 Tax=Citricoccus sp. NPDC055426 TaxID=3155536 RepID=UPI0034401253
MKVDRSAIRKVLQRVRNTRAYSWALSTSDLAVLQLSVRRRRPIRGSQVGSRRSIILAPTGHGNIGDQAMVEALIDLLDGPILVITNGEGALAQPLSYEKHVTVVPIPGLVDGLPVVRARAVGQFVEALKEADDFFVIGADSMDGLYNTSSSLSRVNLLSLASKMGVQSTAVGFSWSDNAKEVVVERLRSLPADVRLCVRDPLSVERLQASGVPVIPSADIVFTHSRRQVTAKEDAWAKDTDSPVAVINASGLIHKTTDLTEDYLAVVRHVLDLGFKVVLLPHVIRTTDDDLAVLESIAGELNDPRVLLVESLLRPAQVAAILEHASLIVTGRMHLAILGLSQGIAPITLSTQGKVEGLYKLFKLDDFSISPARNWSTIAIPLIDKLVANMGMHRFHINDELARIRDAALVSTTNR